MLSFIGDYTCKADSKCRVVVPASFRRVMVASGQSLFILRKNVLDMCIDMYPYNEWEMMMVRLRTELNLFDRDHATFLREFCRGTQEVEMDANGRILLPKRMLENIGVDKEMVFAAQDSKIQIWEANAYEAVAVDGESLEKLAREIIKK